MQPHRFRALLRYLRSTITQYRFLYKYVTYCCRDQLCQTASPSESTVPVSNSLPTLSHNFPPSSHPPHHRRAARLGCCASLPPKSFILAPFSSPLSRPVLGAASAQASPPPGPVRRAPRAALSPVSAARPRPPSRPAPCPAAANRRWRPAARVPQQPSPGSKFLPSCEECTLNLPCGLPAEWEHLPPQG